MMKNVSFLFMIRKKCAICAKARKNCISGENVRFIFYILSEQIANCNAISIEIVESSQKYYLR